MIGAGAATGAYLYTMLAGSVFGRWLAPLHWDLRLALIAALPLVAILLAGVGFPAFQVFDTELAGTLREDQAQV